LVLYERFIPFVFYTIKRLESGSSGAFKWMNRAFFEKILRKFERVFHSLYKLSTVFSDLSTGLLEKGGKHRVCGGFKVFKKD